jgi:hypothetical protein
MAALTGEVLVGLVGLVGLVALAFAGGLSARAALSVRSIALPEPFCEDCELVRGL